MDQPKFSKSNFWLQTLILDEKKQNIRDQILMKSYKRKIMLRPAWELLHTLNHLKSFLK